MNVEEIRNDLRDIRIFCSRYFPFMVIPLGYARIVATEMIPTAGVDQRGTLAINPPFWQNLNIEEKRFIAIHEADHVCLLHPFRMKGFNQEAYNIAADAKINHAISQCQTSGISIRDGSVTLNSIATITNVRVQDLEKMSTEEITRLLERAGGNGGCEGWDRDLIDDIIEGEEVQAGDKSLTSDDREEVARTWRTLTERAKAFAKTAGNMPAALERLVDEVLEVKPPWQVTIRFGIRNGQKQDASYAYPNRRSDDLPGPIGYQYRVFTLIDTSGSISEPELKTFLGVVMHEARRAQVYAIPWDADSYEVLKAERSSDVARRVAPRMKGGGGTVIRPVLERVYRLMNQSDACIILSDGDIFDEGQSETQEWFRKVAAKSGFAMIGYTHKPVEAQGFAKAFIDFSQS